MFGVIDYYLSWPNIAVKFTVQNGNAHIKPLAPNDGLSSSAIMDCKVSIHDSFIIIEGYQAKDNAGQVTYTMVKYQIFDVVFDFEEDAKKEASLEDQKQE